MNVETLADSSESVGDPLFTLADAAAYLSIPKATLYSWRTRRAGFGPVAVKVSGMLRYRRSDLDAWVAKHVETFEADAVEAAPAESARGKSPAADVGVAMTRRRKRTF